MGKNKPRNKASRKGQYKRFALLPKPMNTGPQAIAVGSVRPVRGQWTEDPWLLSKFPDYGGVSPERAEALLKSNKVKLTLCQYITVADWKWKVMMFWQSEVFFFVRVHNEDQTKQVSDFYKGRDSAFAALKQNRITWRE